MFLRKLKEYWVLIIKRHGKQKSISLGKVQDEVAKELKGVLDYQKFQKEKNQDKK